MQLSRTQRVLIVFALGLLIVLSGGVGLLWLIEGIISKARLHILGLSAPMFLPGLLLVYVCGRNVPRLWRVSREVLKEDARFDWSNLDFGAALRAFFTRKPSPRGYPKTSPSQQATPIE